MRHVPHEDIPQATTAAVMKHFKMIWSTPIEVVLNFISLNFIKVNASRCKDRGCFCSFGFFFCAARINHDTQRVHAGSRGQK